MRKFKVGDIVRGTNNGTYSITDDKMIKGEVVKVFGNDMITVKVLEHLTRSDEIGEEYDVNDRYFELADIVKSRKDLKDGDIITLANGDRLMYLDEDFKDLSDEHDNNILDIFDLNDDLTYRYDEDKEKNKVVKVERPTSYYNAFNRGESPKEMTVEEISKALGYEVKIVKESK